MIRDLKLADVQMVEIIKAVSTNAKTDHHGRAYVFSDEHETQRLFQVIRDLKEQGVAIIYISHRMAEIYETCGCPSSVTASSSALRPP